MTKIQKQPPTDTNLMCLACGDYVTADRFDRASELCTQCKDAGKKPSPWVGTDHPTWSKPTPRQIAAEARRFLKEVRERFSPETQAAIRRSIVSARCGCEGCVADPLRITCTCAACAGLRWLRDAAFESYLPRVCSQCREYVAKQDAVEGAPTPWPILLRDSRWFSKQPPEVQAGGLKHYDSRLDVIVHE